MSGYGIKSIRLYDYEIYGLKYIPCVEDVFHVFVKIGREGLEGESKS
jgi:hypothetical protein